MRGRVLVVHSDAAGCEPFSASFQQLEFCERKPHVPEARTLLQTSRGQLSNRKGQENVKTSEKSEIEKERWHDGRRRKSLF